MKGSGNSYDFGARIYDPRVGRFLNVDPFAQKAVGYSPYGFASNTPIQAVDNNGDYTVYYSQKGKKLFVSHDSHNNAIVIISNKKLWFFLWTRNYMIKHNQTDESVLNASLRQMGKCFVLSDFFDFYDETAQYKEGHYVEHHNQKWLVEFGSYLYVDRSGKVSIGKERVSASGEGTALEEKADWNKNPASGDNFGRVHTHPEIWRMQPNRMRTQPQPSYPGDLNENKVPKVGSENFDAVVGQSYINSDYYLYIYNQSDPANPAKRSIPMLYINYDDQTRGSFFKDNKVNETCKPRYGSKLDALDESIRSK